MPPVLTLVVTARKEVATREEGEALYEWVKERLSDHPEVALTAHISNHFAAKPAEPPP